MPTAPALKPVDPSCNVILSDLSRPPAAWIRDPWPAETDNVELGAPVVTVPPMLMSWFSDVIDTEDALAVLCTTLFSVHAPPGLFLNAIAPPAELESI